jgi:sulfate/thiosulfate transport system ATP-binding protein
MTVAVDGLSVRFGGVAALDTVSLQVAPGEFVALLGPSGSGKTSLLRAIAGLEVPTAGRIAIAGHDMTATPPQQRGIGFVFQQYALFRQMSVADNIAFGLTVRPRARRPGKAEIALRVAELLELVQLPGLGARYPGQLSGGQRQRVALARALAVEPQLLLLDEPFGALDARVRKDLRRWLRDVHTSMGLTSLFVTHDQEEALDLADRVVVLNAGRVEQVATPAELWDHPASSFVCDFLGGANRLAAMVSGRQVVVGDVRLPNAAPDMQDGPAVAFVRPHEWRVAEAGERGVAVTMSRMQRTGPLVMLEAVLPDGKVVEAALPSVPAGVESGATVVLVPLVVRAYPA